jgi:hypothetical protein
MNVGGSVPETNITVNHNYEVINISLTMILHVHPETFQELGNGMIWKEQHGSSKEESSP